MFRKYVFPIVVILSIVLSACGEKADRSPGGGRTHQGRGGRNPPKPPWWKPTKAPVVEAPKYKQSPLFDAAVADGSLPPVRGTLAG